VKIGAEMIKLPGMLMVGAVGRGIGKTRFACSLIKKFGSQRNIIGIKVTTVEKADGTCPRGGSGCGVCSSLQGHYYITEELDKHTNKDTCRMLAAGAGRVFWLRVLKKHLEEGINALLDIIGDDVVSVCESNSLRRIVEPGLFIMIKSCGAKNSKVSAKGVIRYVDRIICFDGSEFDIGADEIGLVEGKWTCKMQATAIIMAGGGSVRMGQDKAMLSISGQGTPFCNTSQNGNPQPMIKHIADQLRPYFNQILISSNDTSKYYFLGLEVIPDKVKGHGPLGGIASALNASANELNFVVACDIPKVDTVLMKTMLRQAGDFDAVVPKIGRSNYEPLFAVYKKDVLAAVDAALLSGNNRIIDALAGCKVKYMDIVDAGRLKNINTMDDYREFIGKESDACI
jgi:molybdopterin-guanine dinucleotide biosynthesis protein A